MANLFIIRNLADAKGLTLRKVSDEIGVSEDGLQKIMKKGSTNTKTLEDIARVLGVSAGIFFENATGISKNTGSVNTGSVGGHNVTISDPAVKKIIDKDKIEVERDLSTENHLQTIKYLNARISDMEARIVGLEKIIEAKDALIKILQKDK